MIKTNWKEIENAENIRVVFNDGEIWECDAKYLDNANDGDTLTVNYEGRYVTLLLNEIAYCEPIKDA